VWDTQIFFANPRKMSTHLVLKVSGVFMSNLDKKFEIVSSLKSVPLRIPQAFINFEKAYLLNP
jgi:hypothetical protein